MNIHLHIHQLTPKHKGTKAWIFGRFIALAQTGQEIELLMEDTAKGTPCVAVFPSRPPFMSLLALAEPDFFIGIYGTIHPYPLTESSPVYIYTITGEEIALWDKKGKEIFQSLPKGEGSQPSFAAFIKEDKAKKDKPSSSDFLPPLIVMKTAEEASLFFTLKEVQLLCYKLFAMVDFASLVLKFPSFTGDDDNEKAAPYPLREDVPQSLYTSQEILAQGRYIKDSFFKVPTPFLTEDQ